MKKIITALANPELNEEISKSDKFKIIGPDIQYQDGVIEVFEKNEEIDILILNGILPGNLSLKEFINIIKEINPIIEIIIILEKEDEETKNFLISKGIFKIFYNNQLTKQELINLIEINNNDNKINEEIKLLKELIIKNKKDLLRTKNNKLKIINKLIQYLNKIINKNKIIINKLKINKKQNNKINKNKIISVVGPNGSGKSIFTVLFATTIKNKQILIIDFDIFNNNINTIFGTKKQNKTIKKNNIFDELKIENLKIEINKKIDLISNPEKLLMEKEKINNEEIKKILNKLLKIYDVIIIDTSSQSIAEYTKQILNNTDLAVFLTEANLLQLQKSRHLLDKYINKWNIPKEKINIIFNKYNINSIDEKILKEMFSEFNILGKIKLNQEYDLIINKYNNNFNNKIKKEYINIIDKIKI